MLVPRLLTAISLLLALTAIAQSPPDSELNVPPGHLRIPVVVTDKQGKPISGLHAEDFKVLDNGKPAPIVAFLALSASPSASAHFTVFYLDDRHLTMEEMKSAQQNVIAALPAALEYRALPAVPGAEHPRDCAPRRRGVRTKGAPVSRGIYPAVDRQGSAPPNQMD